MNTEENIFNEIVSQVELSEWRPSNETNIQKRRFEVESNHDERPPLKNVTLPENVPSSSSHAELMAKVDAIQKGQVEVFPKLDSVEAHQLELNEKMDCMQGALSDKIPERAEFQAQGKQLRECKVLTSRVQQSVSRITGDIETEESIDLSSSLPMSSVEQLQAVESKLRSKSYADAMMGILAKRKGTSGTVDGVMRGLLKDDTAANYNLEGRAGKIPLVGLKFIDLLFDIFPEKSKEEVRNSIKNYVSLSHNRFNQKKYITKRNVNN